MPWKSKAQQRWAYAQKPKGIDLHEWSDKTDFKHLPEKAATIESTVAKRKGGMTVLPDGSGFCTAKVGADYSERFKRMAARRGETVEELKAKLDKSQGKTAGVLPTARLTPNSVTERGDEVHSTLLANPLAQDPQGGPDFERGFLFSQRLGHTALASTGPEDIQRWRQNPPGWVAGFSKGAAELGRGDIRDMLTQQKEAAMTDSRWATEYFTKTAGWGQVAAPLIGLGTGAALGGLAGELGQSDLDQRSMLQLHNQQSDTDLHNLRSLGSIESSYPEIREPGLSQDLAHAARDYQPPGGPIDTSMHHRVTDPAVDLAHYIGSDLPTRAGYPAMSDTHATAAGGALLGGAAGLGAGFALRPRGPQAPVHTPMPALA